MTDYSKDNIFERPLPYKILRQLHLSDGGSYAVQMNLKAGFDEDQAYEIINLLDEVGLVYPVEGTDPKLYDVNYSRFEDLWFDLWSEKIEDVPATPVEFAVFIEFYARSFMNGEEVSTVKEMMIEEFYHGLSVACEGDISNDYEELWHRISEQYESNKAPHEHIKHGLNNVE